MTDWQTARGWMTIDERRALRDLAATRRSPIMNIGIEYGASVWCILAGGTAPVWAIDLDIGKADVELLKQARLTLIQGDSGDYAKGITAKLGGVFIDGDHSFQGVLRDCWYAAHVERGGWMAFHDCYEWPPSTSGLSDTTPWRGIVRAACPEVNAAVNEWYAASSKDWIEAPFVDSMRIFQRK